MHFLDKHKAKLFKMKYDDLLDFLSTFNKSDIFFISENDFNNEKFNEICKVKSEIKKIPITNDLLKNLEMEFNKLQLKIEKKLSNIK